MGLIFLLDGSGRDWDWKWRDGTGVTLKVTGWDGSGTEVDGMGREWEWNHQILRDWDGSGTRTGGSGRERDQWPGPVQGPNRNKEIACCLQPLMADAPKCSNLVNLTPNIPWAPKIFMPNKLLRNILCADLRALQLYLSLSCHYWCNAVPHGFLKKAKIMINVLYRGGQMFSDPLSFRIECYPLANKSCKIECCGYKMHQIIQNMILSWGSELILSLLWRTTISGQ